MLTIKQLNKTYNNGVKALDNLNLTVEHGMFGLLGPNGAGKSSLMRTLATLQSPDSGEIIFNGENILTNPQAMRNHLGYLPQEFGVYPNVSAFDLLNHFAILKGLTNKPARLEQVNALLQQTNLFQHRKKSVSSFSGGMRQRFGIAQALLGAPKIIIVDEPTAGLDPQERNRFHNLLADISEKTIVILSTHIVEDVSNLCPDMAIMAAGKIVKQGAPHLLLDQLSDCIWRKQISKQEVAQFQLTHNVISQRLVAGRAVIHILSDNCPEVGFEPIQADLEDLYFSAINTAVA
jgi:ABC-type multidrug transport system ATPase subunit